MLVLQGLLSHFSDVRFFRADSRWHTVDKFSACSLATSVWVKILSGAFPLFETLLMLAAMCTSLVCFGFSLNAKRRKVMRRISSRESFGDGKNN